MTIKYTQKPIGSIEALSKLLSVNHERLMYLSENSKRYYKIAKKVKKPNGDIRITYDVGAELKDIHRKIKERLFHKVIYPNFLQGSIQGRDYVSNIKMHSGNRLIISEDVSNFFPSISEQIVHQLFLCFFCFPHDVASILTKLVCYNGFIAQGTRTSSYVANLILWQRESELEKNLKEQGINYSRYVDDITISTNRQLSKEQKTKIISDIFGLLFSVGIKPNRKKHAIMKRGGKQTIHKVNANLTAPKLPKEKHSKVRAAVYQCEIAFKSDMTISDYEKLFSKTSGLVAHLGRFSSHKANKYKMKLNLLRPKYKT